MAQAIQMLGNTGLNTGQKASLALHGALVLWVLVFDLFQAPDEPMLPEATEVSIISAQDFAELMNPLPPAAAPPERPVTPPEAIRPPQLLTPPAPITPPAPLPPPEPVSERPQAAVIAPNTTPEASLRPVQRPSERVAPEAAPTPDPTVTIAPRDQAAVAPDAATIITAPEETEATQREAAATETVTEATQISETEPVRRTATAPEVSLRPRARPQRTAAVAPEAPATPAPPPEPAVAPEPQGPSAGAVENALAEALASALGETGALAQSDIDALRLNIETCWNVGLLSQEALGVIVTISFEMTQDSRPVAQSIQLADAQGGSAAAQQAAFDAGRQAIVQCGIEGYGMPAELYDQWRLVEITFNPARMSNR